jgi:hypothetical protein
VRAGSSRFARMAIADDDIERIRSTVSIVDVISPHVQLK